jgi:signal transduction histidine kinase
MKLFPKLALAVSGLLIATLAALTFFFYLTERRQMRIEAGLERQAVLNNLVHIAQESFLVNDDLLLVKYARWIAKWNPTLVSASVIDREGAIVAHSEPSRIGQQNEIHAPEVMPLLVLSAPVQAGSQWVGTASVAFSEQALNTAFGQRLGQLKQRLEEVAILALLASLVICLLLALSWTRPIKHLEDVAVQIGRGHWDSDLAELSRRRDELGGLSRAFEGMTQQLKELDTMKEDFVSAVTHELRSPLGAIESYLNVISNELHEGISLPSWENYLERLRLNTQRLARFVNDLLDVAALERGKIKLEPRPVHLVDLAQDVMGLFALKLKEKGLRYEVRGPETAGWVLADADKIRQVVVNLVSNAIKFTLPGGSVRVLIEPASPQSLRMSIADTGVGISREDQINIFNKFEQVRTSRLTAQGPKGTGLGLAISRALIELHGQVLTVQSEPGQGSTFYFTLPAAVGSLERSAS